MKRLIVSPENPNGTLVDLTAEEIATFEEEKTQTLAHEAEIEAQVQVKKDLKASAKAKLIAGEALTEDEANTIVL